MDPMETSGRLLIAYSNASNAVSTTAEYLASLKKYSNFDVRYVHVTHDAEIDFDLNEFDAVFNSYCARLPFEGYVSASYIGKLKSFRGVKLLAVQDEYDNFNTLKKTMQDIGFHVMFNNASPELTARLYPRAEFPDTEFIQVLTGYVPEELETRNVTAASLTDRPIHIGYRCRKLPAYYGRLGFEKFEIGRRMREFCVARRVPHDIEWDDNKRLYGTGWYDFIASCRANLGSETGSNVFDLNGGIRATYDRLSAERGEPVSFEEFHVYTDAIEAQYDIGQLSPRIFEAAALRTPLILFSGRYLGVIEPDTHYVELKKDFSNIDDVFERLNDLEALERMADRAYERLVASKEFSYRRFAGRVGKVVVRKAAELGVILRPPTKCFDAVEPASNSATFATLSERPTTQPRHPDSFGYKQTLLENAVLKEEISRLNRVYTEVIARLNALIACPPRAPRSPRFLGLGILPKVLRAFGKS
jgi:hypothetical protein